jgi:hypothetical protein
VPVNPREAEQKILYIMATTMVTDTELDPNEVKHVSLTLRGFKSHLAQFLRKA